MPRDAARGRSRWWRWVLVLTSGVVAVAMAIAGLIWAGVVHPNSPSREQYPIWGVDVSRYQGEIDWPVLASQGIEFAFIKATEGSSYVDPRFASNLEGASAAGVRAGAYHFFSFESPGSTQAANLVRQVPADPELLPVVVDLEYYGQFWTSPPPVDDVQRELGVLLAQLIEHYGKSPIVYTTGEAYNRYLAGAFPEVDIWIRDVWRTPTLADGRAWTFWQFTDRHRLAGYQGEEEFIDVNVFAGDRAAWQQYGR